MDDLISRQAAIDALWRLDVELRPSSIDAMLNMLNGLPSSQPERTESIPETKAVRSKRDCVDLAERVSATYYDQEHEEWTQKTVTVADVLDSVCDEYTILPYVQPTIDAVPVIRCRDCVEFRRWDDESGECYDGLADGAMVRADGYCYAAERRNDGIQK